MNMFTRPSGGAGLVAGADFESTWTPKKEEDHLYDNDGYGYDFVLVFDPRDDFVPNPRVSATCGEALSADAKDMLKKMIQFELQLRAFWSAERDEIFVKVRAPLHVIERVADLIDMTLEVDPVELKKLTVSGTRGDDGGWRVEPIFINEDPMYCQYTPFEFIYGVYDTDEERKRLFKKKLRSPPGGRDHPFTGCVRLKLMQEIFTNRHLLGFNLNHIRNNQGQPGEKNPGLKQYFPLHNDHKVRELENKWIKWYKLPWTEEPFDDIKEYFGEQIGLYFVFLNHYLIWLTVPAVAGLGVQFNVLGTMNTQAEGVPPFIVLVSCWCILMLEFWKRKEVDTAMKWGTRGFRVSRERPGFRGVDIKSYIDGESILYYPPNEKFQKVVRSSIIIFTSVMLVLAVVGSIFAFRYALLISGNSLAEEYAPVAASVLNAISIQVLNYFYGSLADALTEEENHRTFDEFENALIFKLFAFQFVNSYSSFFYIAFLQQGIEGDCGTATCMDALATNMATIFTVALSVGNVVEVVLPLLSAHYKVKALMDKMESQGVEYISLCEFQAMQEEYDASSGTMDDYLELTVQFGFVVLFAAALPAAPFMAWISNYFEYRFDAIKLIKVLQRPMPRPAETIGSWLVIFQTLSIVAVVTNAGLMCFTFEDIWDIEWTVEGRLWTFIIFQYFVFVCMYVLELAVPDIADDTETQIQRQEFLSRRVINQEADDDDDFNEARVYNEEQADGKLHDLLEAQDVQDEDRIDFDNIKEYLPLARAESMTMTRPAGGGHRNNLGEPLMLA
uniref:Anoctamin transmembrane domain-containing protein n=1 Tax=Phaeomonas parva TaxID=124430 RepID=A0A6U4EFG3_9STRA|mmetsp:Transcript_20329/g.61706  ORF Transcript_20329/g.61706 Transcript_20329/m.61706 type:complete len:786 (+) Transcript_20329:204-2561(+)